MSGGGISSSPLSISGADTATDGHYLVSDGDGGVEWSELTSTATLVASDPEDIFSGNLNFISADSFMALPTGSIAVPSTAIWLYFNFGSSNTTNPSAAVWYTMLASEWRSLDAATTGTGYTTDQIRTIRDFFQTSTTGSSIARDLRIGRTSSNEILLSTDNASEDAYGLSIKYTEGVSPQAATVETDSTLTGDGSVGDLLGIADGGVDTTQLADDAVTDAKIDTMKAAKLTGTIDDARIPATIARDTELPAANRLIPSGGTDGQVLTKSSVTDYAVAWEDGITSIETDSTLSGAGTTSDMLGIADDGVTQAKLADDSVGGDQLIDDSISEQKLSISNAPANGDFLFYDGIDGMSWETLTAPMLDSGSSTDGQVLTSDGSGNALWEDAPEGDTTERTFSGDFSSITGVAPTGFANLFFVTEDINQSGFAVNTSGGISVIAVPESGRYQVHADVPMSQVSDSSGNARILGTIRFARTRGGVLTVLDPTGDAYIRGQYSGFDTGVAVLHAVLDLEVNDEIEVQIFASIQAGSLDVDGGHISLVKIGGIQGAAGTGSTVDTDSSLTGDGSGTSPLGIADGSITEAKLAASNTPTDGQVLTYDATDGLTWAVDDTDSGGLSTVSTDATIDGDGSTGSPLSLADAAVTDAKIVDMAATKLTGLIDDARIPSSIARDTELPDVSSFIESDDVKVFARTGGRDIESGDITSLVATKLTGLIDDARIPSTIARDTELPDANRLVPSGGATGQVLKKTAGTDYAVEWAVDETGIGGISSVATDSTIDGDGSTGSPLSLADAAVTDAKIVDMAASKLTGTIDDARIPASIARDTELPAANRLIPSGGTTGQVLAKASGTAYDIAWGDASSGGLATVSTDATIDGDGSAGSR